MDLPTGTASAYNAALTSQGRLPRNRLEAMAMLKRILMVLLVALAAVAFVASASAQKKKYPWEKEPGPIAGRWKLSVDVLLTEFHDTQLESEIAIAR